MTWQGGCIKSIVHLNYITNDNYYIFKDKILLFYMIKIEICDPKLITN
jgi:hypothetical protein